MKLNDSWQDMFSSRVLSKGYDYYLSDSIHNVRKSGDGYEAKIRGSYEYGVYVSIKDGKLIDADCSCPYASDGNFCKHEAHSFIIWKMGVVWKRRMLSALMK